MGQTKKRFFGGLLVALCLAILPVITTAKAPETPKNVFIGADEVINHNVFKTGNLVVIEGAINGDAFLAGATVLVKGSVSGNLFVAGSSVNISGDIGGSIFAAGSMVSVTGKIGQGAYIAGSSANLHSAVAKSAYVFGGSVSLSETAFIGLDLITGGASVEVRGRVGRNANAYANSVSVENQISGDLSAQIEEDGVLALMSKAKIGGNLYYKSAAENQLVKQSGATVGGQTVFQSSVRDGAADQKGRSVSGFVLVQIIRLFWLVVTGLVLVAVMPKPVKRVSSAMLAKPWANMGWGLIYLIVTPIVCVILLATVIGLPLALILGAGYAVALFVTKVLAAVFIGALIIGSWLKKKDPGLIWSLILGGVILVLITAIPFIGWFLSLVMTIWALGALVRVKKEMIKKINE